MMTINFRKIQILPLLFWSFILLLVITPNYSYYWDGVTYAWILENENYKELFYKHHLLYAPLCRLMYAISGYVGVHIRAIYVMIVVNIISGLVYISFAFRIFKLFNQGSWYLKYIVILMLGFSYTFSTYLRNVDPYIIPITLSAYALLRITGMASSGSRQLVTGLDWFFILLSSLFHEVALFVLPAMIYADSGGKLASLRKTIIRVVLFVISLLVIDVLVYFLIYQGPLNKMPNWFIGTAGSRYYSFSDQTEPKQIFSESLYQSTLSNEALFLAPVEREKLGLHEFKYYPVGSWFAMLVEWITFLTIALFIFYGAKLMLSEERFKIYVKFLLIWILPYMIFFFFFTPYNSFYRLFYLLPLLIMFYKGAGAMMKRMNNRILLIFAVLCMVVINVLFGFLPESNKKNNPYLMQAIAISKVSKTKDLILLTDRNYDNYKYMAHINYFSNKIAALYHGISPEKTRNYDATQVNRILDETCEYINGEFDNVYLAQKTKLIGKFLIWFKIPKYTIKGGEPCAIDTDSIVYHEFSVVGDIPYTRIEIEPHEIKGIMSP